MKEVQLAATKDLLSFIKDSPTAFHAVRSASRLLDKNGFTLLQEGEDWELTLGGNYYVTRNQSSIIAFHIPKFLPQSFMISASHTDSPMFKLKPNAESLSCNQYGRLNTEVYGGTILSSWMDRPLTLAGRAILSQNGEFSSVLVAFSRDLCLIPNVSIHFNRSVNTGYAYNPAVDMLPLFCEKGDSEQTLKRLVAEELGCKEAEIVGLELFAVSNTQGSIWGADQSYFSAPRIDNLMCTFGTLNGFLQSKDAAKACTVWYAADNEETGSATKQGAGSVFLSDVLSQICNAFSLDKYKLLSASMMVSADNAHAKHPNHPELSDANNAPLLNGGVVIKLNAAQKYTTDGISAALFSAICQKASVPVQYFANRSDMAGGSTLGSISNTLVPLISVDIGMAQLAMHSAYETAGVADTLYLTEAMTAFYKTKITKACDGVYRVDE